MSEFAKSNCLSSILYDVQNCIDEKESEKVSFDDINTALCCKELIDLRDGLNDSILTAREYFQLIDYLCTI